MTTTVEHDDDRPPAAGVLRDVAAEVRSRRSMLALAAVESGRLLLHPAVLAATALSVWLLWRWGRGTAPVLHYADIATQLPLAPLAAAALLAANLAVLRPHRDGAVDLYGATRLSLARRTLAHLLSVLPLAALGGVLVAADLAWLASVPGSAGAPDAAEAATGPALILLGGCLGVALGRCWRSVALAPLVLVVLGVGSLTLAELYVGGHDGRPWVWLGTLLRPVTIDPPPAALLGRPATWHLVYLLGAAVVLGALAVWRGQAQARARRRAQAVTGAVLVAALAVTAGAAVVQTRPTSPALVARRLAAASNPAAHQVCQRQGPAVYCVFPGFEPQIGLWEPTVRAVLAGVPPAVAARAVPVTVAQRIGWARLSQDEGGLAADQLSARGDRPVAPVGTAWGRDGRALAASQARLAGNVAARVMGRPVQVPEADGEQPKSSSGPAFTLSLGLLALAVRPGLALPAGRLVLWLRITMTVGALGCAFLLDDPSEPTTEGVAGSLLLRRSLRVALLLPATAAWWIGVMWRVRAVHPGLPLPIAALTLEVAALLAVTVALAAAGSRLAPERRGGVVAAPALLALASAAFLLPARVALYAMPGSAAWDGAHRRLTLLLGLALAAFAAASRDPASRRLPSQLRGIGHGLARGRATRAEARRSGTA